jgi:hypothetical protein
MNSNHQNQVREVEDVIEWQRNVRHHTECFHDYINNEHICGDASPPPDAVISRMDCYIADAFTDKELSELIREALTHRKLRDKYESQIEFAAHAYATDAAQ